MCVVIDANVIGKVFDRRNAEHARFRPIATWVTTGNGSVIYGGTKYMKELGEGKFLALFTELSKVRRAIMVSAMAVDDRARVLKELVPDKDFDDEHIVAIIGVSRCCLVCTDDVRALPYLKRKDLYPDGVKIPHIYRSLADKRHCCNRLIVEICPNRSVPVRRGKKPKSRPKVAM